MRVEEILGLVKVALKGNVQALDDDEWMFEGPLGSVFPDGHMLLGQKFK